MEQSDRMENIRQRTHDGVDNIMDKAKNLRDNSEETLARLKEKATMAKDNVDGYIKKNPEKSVLIAAGVGLAVGAIIAGAMMRRKN